MSEDHFRRRLEAVKCVLVDLHGTLIRGESLLDGAMGLITAVRESGRKLIVTANHSGQTADAYAAQLTKLGLELAPEDIYTSVDAGVAYLLNFGPGHRLCVLGSDHMKSAFSENGFLVDSARADALVLGTYPDFDFANLQAGVEMLRRGVPFYATHGDAVFPAADGRLVPDCGAIAAAFATASGVRPTWFGLPAQPMMDGILQKSGVGKEELLMIGDDLTADVGCARVHGLLAALVLTGVSSPHDATRALHPPDLVVPSLKALPVYFSEQPAI